MVQDNLDEYIAEHSTLLAELGWNADSNMACHSFQEGLPKPLIKTIVLNEGMPDSLRIWV